MYQLLCSLLYCDACWRQASVVVVVTSVFVVVVAVVVGWEFAVGQQLVALAPELLAVAVIDGFELEQRQQRYAEL